MKKYLVALAITISSTSFGGSFTTARQAQEEQRDARKHRKMEHYKYVKHQVLQAIEQATRHGRSSTALLLNLRGNEDQHLKHFLEARGYEAAICIAEVEGDRSYSTVVISWKSAE